MDLAPKKKMCFWWTLFPLHKGPPSFREYHTNRAAMTSGESPQDAASSYRTRPPSPSGPHPTDPVAGVSSGREAPVAGSGRATGTILEGAFVDPAYPWPPAEGQGKHAIELQASTALLRSAEERDAGEDEEVSLSPSMVSSEEEGQDDDAQEAPKFEKKKISGVETVVSTKGRFCCKRIVTEEIVSEKEVHVDESVSSA